MGTFAKQHSELVAKRWARALLELAQEDEGISKDDILDDLREISDCISNSEELSNVINNPSISTQEKQIVLCKLFQNKVMPVVYNFVIALNLKKRIGIIPAITEAFQKELEVMKNIARVNVTSAIDINDDKKADIRNKIAEKLKKDVIVDWNVDTDIIAGLIFNIDETIIDNSIKHRLDDLNKMIKG